jgi:hypothetical protein
VQTAARPSARRSRVCRLAALVAVAVAVAACTITSADDQLIDSPPTELEQGAFRDGIGLDRSVSSKEST